MTSRPAVELPSRLRIALLGAAFAGGLMLAISELLPLLEVRAVTATVKVVDGGPHHGYALLVLGLAALPMAWGATEGGSRPAMVALTLLGAIALAVALIGDLPDVTANGVLDDFEAADAHPRIGFYLETLGGVLILVAGGAQLLLTGGRGPVAAPRSRWTQQEDAADEDWAREAFERVRGDREP